MVNHSNHLKRWKSISVFMIFLLLCAMLFDSQNIKAERLPVKTYTVADGLLRDNVTKIKQDSRGFLWFCTSEGISRFDGYGFTNYTTANGLPDRHVYDFLETRNGTIWIATEGGLAKLDPNAKEDNGLFTTLIPENPKAKIINVLYEDENGTVFAGTRNGFFKIIDDKLTFINLAKSTPNINEIPVTSIIKDQRGAMWIGTEKGLYRILPDETVEHFDEKNGLPFSSITTVFEDKNGRIWLGLRPSIKKGLSLLVENPQKDQNIVERSYGTEDGLPADWVTDLLTASDGKFWVATTGGVCQWQGGESSVCKIYNSANNLCDRDIWTINEDKDGNLWFGTICGVKKLARYGFTAYETADWMKNPPVNSIFETPAGELIVSYNSGFIRAVSRFDGENFEFVKPNFPSAITYFGWGNSQTVWQDETGDWWFPTASGLYKFSHPSEFKDLEKVAPQVAPEKLKDAQIFRLFEDSRGNFWIFDFKLNEKKESFGELWLWERKTNNWREFTKDLNLSGEHFVQNFAEDRSGNIWIGTSDDASQKILARYRDGNLKVFTSAGNEKLSGGFLRIYADSKNRLWLTNPAMGLLRLDDVNAENLNFIRYTPSEGLSSIGVITVTEDAYGRIYVGTGRGLDRLTPETGQVENFTTADGLPASYVELSFRDRQNNLWFGTDKGVAKFTPEPLRTRKPPNVLITGLHISGVAQNVSILGETAVENVELNSDQRQITIDFLGLGANPGENLKYEYRFADSDWTTTDVRTINFANLASGSYQFEVRAQTADRIYSQNSAIVAFHIASPIWQKWWFAALISIFIAGLIYLIYKNRVRRLLELERVRTRIATDLHDDIGANLTRISLLSEVAKQKATNGNGQLLSSIADIARESVASMNDIVWAIAPEHDSLLDLTRRMRRHAEEVFAFRDIEMDFNSSSATDLKLSVGVRRDVLLIFKEAVNNAAKHSDCSRVSIDFRCENSVLKLKVEDDGKGFDKEAETDGQGLRSLARRAESLGGQLTIDSSFGEGTVVKFEMSLQKASQV